MLERAMDSTRAWELLGDPEYCGKLTMGGLHNLLLRAGYPEKAAHETAKQWGWDRLSAGEVM